MTPILQDHLPDEQRAVAAARLPSMRPVTGPWITVDSAYTGQLGEKARLMRDHRAAVCGVLPEAEEAVSELLDVILVELPSVGFTVTADQVTRPDGQVVTIDRNDPFMTLSQLVQEDLCLLQKQGDEHVLTAALLCFPAAWTLAEKIGRPLLRIHVPVPSYTEDIGKRVQRLFDGAQPLRPMWRANLHSYEDATLFHVRSESNPRPYTDINPLYERSERQTVMRLPKTGAVLFAIHTTMVAI